MQLLPRIAAVAAFLSGGLALIGALFGPIVLVPFALVPILAGIGILRRRAWSAYGLALYLSAQIVPVLLLLLTGALRHGAAGILASIAVNLAMAGLFLFAGRSLANTGAPRGRPLPWVLVSTAYALPFLFLQPFVIPSGAMENTLLVGDRVLVRRFPKPTASRGEIIAFAYPVDRNQTYVKRIVGLPGDRIRIVRKTLYRNGVAVVEPYVVHNSDYEDSYRDNFPGEPNVSFAAHAADMLSRHVVNGEVVVPAKSYFVLGDNRDNSLDSRYWGFVPSTDLVGTPLLIYDSEIQPPGDLMERRFSIGHAIRWGRLFKRI